MELFLLFCHSMRGSGSSYLSVICLCFAMKHPPVVTLEFAARILWGLWQAPLIFSLGCFLTARALTAEWKFSLVELCQIGAENELLPALVKKLRYSLTFWPIAIHG
jgi:hypothetical protein